ncbi:MAG: LruC domain-containing protein [Bacteroidota bacterium]
MSILSIQRVSRLGFLLLILLCTAAYTQAQEICNNGIDDDGDGFIDCGDSECGNDANCSDAFTCTNALYQVINNSLKVLDVTTSTYTTIGSASANYNGAGYNVQDGYIYGIRNDNGAYLWRINAQGVETNLGAISNFGGRTYVGDFDENGRLHTYEHGSSPKLFYTDVDATPLQAISQSLTLIGGGSLPGVADITYNNKNKKFYGMASGLQLVEIDPVALTAEVIMDGSQDYTASGGFGAAWSDSEGFSYFSNNSDGRIFRATFAGDGSVSQLVHIANGQPTNANDGMGCFLSGPPFETNCNNGIDEDGDGLVDCDDPDCGFAANCINVAIAVNATAQTGPGGVVSYHLFFTNTSSHNVSGLTMSDVLPTGFTYIGDTIIFDGAGSFDGSLQPTDGATGAISWGQIDLNAGETVQISYDVAVSNSQANGNYFNNVSLTGAELVGSNSTAVQIDFTLTSNPVTFDCEPAFYQVYQKPGESNVYGKLNPVTGDYSVISLISYQANGLGFDVQSNLAYGAVGKNFISLDDEGTVKMLGLSFTKKCYVGDMDTLGNWYGKVNGNILKIDVSGPTLLATYSGQGMPGWDMAYNKDGNFYAVHNGTLYKFNTSTNTKSTVASISGDPAPSGGYGAQWTGKDGYLYISHNSTGEVYRIDVATGEARFVLQSYGGLRYNDGFSCPIDIPAIYKKDYSDLSTHSRVSHLVYAQDVYGDNEPDYKMVWLGKRVSEDLADNSNASADGDSYDDGLNHPLVYRPGGTAGMYVSLNTNFASQEVFYGMWIDWDNNGSYEDFYNGSKTITGMEDVLQTVNVPANFTSGSIAVRLRAAEKAFSSGDDDNDLLLGEVEDYLIPALVNGSGNKDIVCLKVNFACRAPQDSIAVYNNAVDNDVDKDGIPNDDDPDPKDPNRQFQQCKPSCNTFGTLAFEDLWPQKGDYDFNDFVVQIKERIITNQTNNIYQIKYDLRIMAMGGAYNNDFCMAFPNPNDNASVAVYSPAQTRHVIEATDDGYSVVKINKPKELLGLTGTELVNAEDDGLFYNPIEVQVVVDLNGDYQYPGGYTPKFFIEGNGINGHEIHLPGVAPTASMKTDLFGTVDDDSNTSSSKYFLSSNNLPWAIYIPRAWEYPLEGVDLIDAYFRFDEYAEQSPTLTWYLDDNGFRVEAKTYRRH